MGKKSKAETLKQILSELQKLKSELKMLGKQQATLVAQVGKISTKKPAPKAAPAKPAKPAPKAAAPAKPAAKAEKPKAVEAPKKAAPVEKKADGKKADSKVIEPKCVALRFDAHAHPDVRWPVELLADRRQALRSLG